MQPVGSIYAKCQKLLSRFLRRSRGKCTTNAAPALLGSALVVMILAVYLQVGTHQFLNFDDDVYVTKNTHVAGGLTGQNMAWAGSWRTGSMAPRTGTLAMWLSLL